MKRPATLARFAVPLALLVALCACGSDSNNDNALDPQFEPEVINLQDAFSFQTTGITDITDVLYYSWSNTGVAANVDQSCSISEGEGTLEVMDAQGTTVYSRNLSDDGSFQSTSGTAGDWTIRVTLSAASGTLNFSLEKRAP